jgi:hypothetical protein
MSMTMEYQSYLGIVSNQYVDMLWFLNEPTPSKNILEMYETNRDILTRLYKMYCCWKVEHYDDLYNAIHQFKEHKLTQYTQTTFANGEDLTTIAPLVNDTSYVELTDGHIKMALSDIMWCHRALYHVLVFILHDCDEKDTFLEKFAENKVKDTIIRKLFMNDVSHMIQLAGLISDHITTNTDLIHDLIAQPTDDAIREHRFMEWISLIKYNVYHDIEPILHNYIDMSENEIHIRRIIENGKNRSYTYTANETDLLQDDIDSFSDYGYDYFGVDDTFDY